MTDLNQLERDLLAQVEAAGDEAALEAVRVSALGKKGSVSELLKTLGAMTPEERKERGPLINGLRDKVQAAIATEGDAGRGCPRRPARRRAHRRDAAGPRGSRDARAHPPDQPGDRRADGDLRRYGLLRRRRAGHRDRLSQLHGAELPEGHPAREMHDTFFLAPDASGERKVLRTHTSPVQIRTMKAQQPPIRVIIPGRTYRHDSDQTHTPMFHQVEGLVIDKQANIAHMKWVWKSSARPSSRSTR